MTLGTPLPAPPDPAAGILSSPRVPPWERLLEQAVATGALRPLDLHLSRWLVRLAGSGGAAQQLAAALVSLRTGAGDVCLDLARFAGTQPFPAVPGLQAPALADWCATLAAWSVVGAPGGAPAPLVLDGELLYLGRYHAAEQAVARGILALVRRPAPPVDRARLRAGLQRLFGPVPTAAGSDHTSAAAPDWQRSAAALAVLQRFCVISGGPGTGKTYTVARILALLAEAAGGVLRIALAAPTGKAAARLTESIRAARAEAALDPALAALIPEQAQTLHRLLGFRPGRERPRHHAGNPLHLDLLVVDEASMLDLTLMARLLAALPATARLILLGDREQLASVEAGMVLGDLCGRARVPCWSAPLRAALAETAGAPAAVVSAADGAPVASGADTGATRGRRRRAAASSRGAAGPQPRQLDLFAAPAAMVPGPAAGEGGARGLDDHIVLLRHSRRFRPESGIGALAAAVNTGDAAAMQRILAAGHPDLRHLVLDAAGLRRLLQQELVPAYRACLAAGDPAAVLAAFDGFRVLCAVHEGPFGVSGLNAALEEALTAAAVIRRDGQQHYAGRPLMISHNDHALGLYNGDIGILLPLAANAPAGASPLRAWFPGPDGPRRLLPARLPAAETVYAMTVHKSQGSEFDRVYLVLPPQPSPALTRELVYTGLTRARTQVILIAPTARLIEAAAAPVRRASGLYAALWS